MRLKPIHPIRSIAISIVLSGACYVLGQSGGSATSLNTGVTYPPILTSPGSQGAAPSISAIDSSVSGSSVSSMSESASANGGIYIADHVTGAPTGSSSHGGSAAALGDLTRSFSGSSKRWSGGSSGFGAESRPISGFSVSGSHGLQASASLTSAGHGNETGLSHHRSLASPSGQTLLFQLNSLGFFGGNGAATLSNDQRQSLSGLPPGVVAAIAGGQYSADFPDSTKNTALVSPPDLGNTSPFTFQPVIARGFPDLSDYQFLRPHLHVAPKSMREKEREDVYARVERMLAESRTGLGKQPGIKAGLKEDKLAGSALKTSSSRRKLDQGLKKDGTSVGLLP